MNIEKTDRYVLDAQGKLHPLRRRYHVMGVAIVTVRFIKRPAPEAIAPGGCAPPVSVRREKIDLRNAPSSMEQTAASWKGKA